MGARILQCGACGGRIAYVIEDAAAACVFCGAEAMAPSAHEEVIPTPERHVPLTVDQEAATARFREVAGSSWFRPAALRSATFQLHTVLLPAWYVHCDIETHFAGLVPAHSPSKRAPTAGTDHARLDHLVPASGGLTSAELNELRPFELEHAVAWEADASTTRMEIPACTESNARDIADQVFRTHHHNALVRQHGLSDASSTSVVTLQHCELMLLPVHIGAVRFRDRPWRVLVNARTGEVIGTLPWDRLKIAAVVLATALLVAGAWWLTR